MMNFKELKTPIRIYWDVTPAAPDVHHDWRRTCEELVEMKILSLNLVDSAPSLSDPCLQILERLKNENIAISLALTGAALNPSTANLLHGLHVRALFLMVSSLDELQSFQGRWQARSVLRPGVYFAVHKKNYGELPEVLSFCLDNDIPSLMLPMQRFTGKHDDCFYLNGKEKEELASRLTGIRIPATLKVVIHDPFLWKIFFPAVEFPEGGCQGANTMLYFSPEGDVYPCPSLPVKLGTLMGTSLKEIVSASGKRELREKLLRAPAGCVHCDELLRCMGGCRGRALVVSGSLDAPDPGCR